MYNPGYWMNRVSPRDIAGRGYTCRHVVRIGVAGMLLSGFVPFAFAHPAIEQAELIGTSFIGVMLDELTVSSKLYFVPMFVLFLALFVRGMLDRVVARRSSPESDAAQQLTEALDEHQDLRLTRRARLTAITRCPPARAIVRSTSQLRRVGEGLVFIAGRG